MYIDSKLLSSFELKTDFIFDTQFHPELGEVAGFATIEGNIEMFVYLFDLLYFVECFYNFIFFFDCSQC